MTVPFANLKNAVAAEIKTKGELSMAELFFRKVYPDQPAIKLMKVVRGRVDDGMSVGEAITSAYPDIPFDVYVTNRACNAHCLLTGDFRKNDLMRWAMSKIGQSFENQTEAAVLLKLNNLGIFVMHNVTMAMQSNPRVVIPASTTGISQIQIIHLDYFADDFLGRKLEK